jgi:hypothetical protein
VGERTTAPPNCGPSQAAPSPLPSAPSHAALNTVSNTEVYDVMEACDPSPSNGWTSAQFHTVMRLMCANPYGAVLQNDMVAALGPSGKTVVGALVDANILSLRSGRTAWERQLPQEAWGEDSKKALVMAATAPHMYAIRQAWAEAQLAKQAELAKQWWQFWK